MTLDINCGSLMFLLWINKKLPMFQLGPTLCVIFVTVCTVICFLFDFFHASL